MPLEGPISGRLLRTSQRSLEDRLADQVQKGSKKVLGETLTGLFVDHDQVRDAVHEVLTQIWGDVGPANTAATQALKDAARTFVQPELTPAERRAKLAHAAGDPLTDAVLAVLVDVAALVPAGALTKGAGLVGKSMGDSNVKDAVAAKWFAPFVPSADGVASLGPALESLRARLREPKFRDDLSRALDVIRVLGRLEAHNLEKIAVDVDKAREPAVKDALVRFSTTIAQGVVRSAVPRDGELGALVRDLMELTSLQTRALVGKVSDADAERFRTIVGRLGHEGDPVRGGILEGAAALHDTAQAARTLPQVFDDAEARLMQDLNAAGALTPAATEGIRELSADLSAVSVTAAHLFRLFGAARNDKIPEEERVDLVKHAATDAGPVVVKLLQTFANQAAADNTMIDGVTHRALFELQERVPEMTEAQVRSQIELGLGKKLEDAYVSFDMKPVASASVSQVHHAWIKTRFGMREVGVKVQRPNLDEDFARATRVARLGLQFASELVKVMSERGKLPFDVPEGMDPVKVMKLVEETVASFVEAFHIETDFDSERVNLKKFRRDMQAHGHVTAPYVYRRWSSGTIVTMEFMRLEKIPSLLHRAQVANEQRKVQAPTGLITADADVGPRAIDHVARAFGIRVDNVAVERDGDRWVATMKTTHPLFPVIKLGFENPPYRGQADPPGAVIRHILTPPVLNNDKVRLVRDRFLASVMAQAIIHGRVHGDPHKGNWGVLADTETVAMLDFGKMVDLKKKHLTAPMMVAWNWFRRDPSGMADALLTMSTATGNVKKSDARKALVDAFTELQKTAGDKQRLDGEQILTTATSTLAAHGLGLSSVYTQGIKAGFSFAMNFAALDKVGAGDITLGSLGRAGRIVAGDALDTATLGVVGSVLALRKNARVSALNRAPKTE